MFHRSHVRVAINSRRANPGKGTFSGPFLAHARHPHLAFLIATNLKTRSGAGQIPLSNPDPSHRHSPSISPARDGDVGGREMTMVVVRKARNVVIAEIMAVPTGERNAGDYVTLKFNSAIVRRARGVESEGTLILFRKTAGCLAADASPQAESPGNTAENTSRPQCNRCRTHSHYVNRRAASKRANGATVIPFFFHFLQPAFVL